MIVVFYKMILADDEEDVRISIEKKINWNSLGFEIAGSVNNGEEALELAEHNHIDVVMTDIKMPFMDGLTLSAKLKENYKNTKVVLSLDKEFDERRNLETLRTCYQKSLPMMREQLLAVLGGDSLRGRREIQTGQMLMLSLMNLTKECLEMRTDV